MIEESRTSSTQPDFHGDQIAVVGLRNWLDWATGRSQDVAVALPMIQRGSVWKPLQIVELWDSLLRGMPIGSLTVTRQEASSTVTIRKVGHTEAMTQEVKQGTLFLLDGQQRTLAMCIGWTGGTDRRVWVDFGRDGVDGRPFQLRVTTQNQPFGFDPQEPNKRLSRSIRDQARAAYDANHPNSDIPIFKLPLDETLPYDAKHPWPLHQLISTWRKNPQQDPWGHDTFTKLSLSPAEDGPVHRRVRAFGKALAYLWEMKLALVLVPQGLMEPAGTGNDEAVPALVTLFQRIANGGQPLSNADYIFSLIKHRLPAAHNYVASLHSDRNVASLLSANDLVMTAVRVAAAVHTHSEGKAFPDYVSPSPKEFGRILRLSMDGESSFLAGGLLPLILPEAPCSLRSAFAALQTLLEYRADDAEDPGLPRLAFPLLGRPLVQVLVFWIHHKQRSLAKPASLPDALSPSRKEVLRFVLFWMLGILDKDKASSACISFLRGHEASDFPGKELYTLLYDKSLACGLQPLQMVKANATTRGESTLPVGCWESRFGNLETDTPEEKEAKTLYSRWFHHKSMLLWLQRRMLTSSFPQVDPLAGRDEETPYDYDHICPGRDWAQDFRSYDSPFKILCENRQANIIGNCLGNFQVLDSRLNRSHQDASPIEKLGLEKPDSEETRKSLQDGLLGGEDELALWTTTGHWDTAGQWSEKRALAFQAVVEKRAFRLFALYYIGAGFEAWLPIEQDSTDISS